MKNKKLFKGVYNWTFLLIVIGAVILLNVIGAFVYKRFDITADKRYSLSQGTIEYISNKDNFTDRISFVIVIEWFMD